VTLETVSLWPGYRLGITRQQFRHADWLEKAYSEKAGRLQAIKTVKPMDPFRSDPRYIDLLKRMGLPQ
jgi:hypothetical protein